MHAFSEALQAQTRESEPDHQLQTLHQSLLRRLDFLAGKLDGLESYAHVSLERLKSQREVVSISFPLIYYYYYVKNIMRKILILDRCSVFLIKESRDLASESLRNSIA